MCFVQDFLIVNTVLNNYYINLSDFKPYGNFMESSQSGQMSPNAGKEVNHDNAVSYMTTSSTSPRDRKNLILTQISTWLSFQTGFFHPFGVRQAKQCRFKAEVLEIHNETGEELMEKSGAEGNTTMLVINKLVALDNKIGKR